VAVLGRFTWISVAVTGDVVTSFPGQFHVELVGWLYLFHVEQLTVVPSRGPAVTVLPES
jgi:hypothetical protein